MEKTAVFSVIFPANLPFFSAYLDSLTQQKEQHFDLLLLIDGVSDMETRLLEYRDMLNIKTRIVSGSVAAIREYAIEWILSLSYDFIIFSDTDDLFTESRVAVCCHHLESYTMVVNDVSPFTEEQNAVPEGFWKNRLPDRFTFSANDVERYNFAGLGNSAVRKEMLRPVQIPEQLVAVDWFLFYQWLQGVTAIFIHDGAVRYRQHSTNLIGLHQVDEKKMNRILNTKLLHYQHLASGFPQVKKYLTENKNKQKMIENPEQRSRILEDINTKTINYFWWEETEYIHE
jgi:hypothetical protein